MWGSLIGGVVGGLGSLFGGKKEAKQQRANVAEGLRSIDAGTQALNQSTLNTAYAQPGAAAYQGMLGALGVGGDPTSAATAFQTFRDSAGYGAALDAGNDALIAQMSAAGMRNSGASMKAGIRFGQGLGAQYFNNYISALNNAAGIGANAAGTVATTNANLAGTRASVATGSAAQGAAQASGNAISDLGGIVGGTIRDIWG